MTRRDNLALIVLNVAVGTFLLGAALIVLDVALWRALVAGFLLGAGTRAIDEAIAEARTYRRSLRGET